MSERVRPINSDESLPPNDQLLEEYLERVEQRGITLYPEQESAILELYEDRNVIQNTPTGSGKSLVAFALLFKSLRQGRRSVYTSPIKALVNEKWLDLCREFGPENVGLSTGDASVNRTAPVLCCTAEILANIALKEGSDAGLHDIVMDEFHYYSDPDRGMAWQIPLLVLSRSRFLLMSATLGNTRFFKSALTQLTGQPTTLIQSGTRPVPLRYEYRDTALVHTVEELIEQNRHPLYLVHFTQADAAQNAQDFTSIKIIGREEKQKIAEILQSHSFKSPYGPTVKRWLKHGIGIHHAGLLPRYRVLVEQLAQKGLLKVICGTDTLGVGINVPIRTVVFTRLCKFDGRKTGILTSRDFHQIAGRAGRKGFDQEGWVVVQPPEHVIENQKLQKKSARTGKKYVKKSPPEHNFVPWDEKTFQRLIKSTPETLVSRFNVTHGMLINVLGRSQENGCRAMRQLIRDCHDSPPQKKQHGKRAWQLFRALLDQRIVQLPAPGDSGHRVRVNVELQENFSMNQSLSLYLLETIERIDPEAEDYPLVMLSLVEAIMENPDIILAKQLDKLKTKAIAEMKQQGLDYQQRMDKLETLEYPKPNREFIYETFNDFVRRHPWVDQENIRPKSIVREMFESFRSFDDYIKDYSLHRAEGLLLRHLSGVYKTLVQTVPENRKNERLYELEVYLKTRIEQTDSSLVDEWRRIQHPDWKQDAPTDTEQPADPAPDITRDQKTFKVQIRQIAFGFLRELLSEQYESAFSVLQPPQDDSNSTEEFTEKTEWRRQAEEFLRERERLRLDPEARNARHSRFEPQDNRQLWKLQQTLVDPEERNDWFAEFQVDLKLSKKLNRPSLTFIRLYHL